jgi:enolase
MKIKDITSRPIINSEGNWSVETKINLKNGQTGIASVPQGISTGEKEKLDKDGKESVAVIDEQIRHKILNLADLNQEKLDQVLLSNPMWPSSATLSISVAFAKASGFFQVENKKMPQMMVLIFEGEKHGNPNLTIQEFMIVVNDIEEGIGFYKKTKEHLEKNNVLTTVGSEGGFSPQEYKDQEILSLLKDLGASNIALDVAGNVNPPSVERMLEILKLYPIISLEDPFAENKIEDWQEFYPKALALKPQLLIVADDLTVTEASKIKSGAEKKLFNAVIIKANQRGTITQAVKAANLAKELNLKTIISHRGAETNDHWAADLALVLEADYVKFGAPARGERVAKYNRLLALKNGN